MKWNDAPDPRDKYGINVNIIQLFTLYGCAGFPGSVGLFRTSGGTSDSSDSLFFARDYKRVTERVTVRCVSDAK